LVGDLICPKNANTENDSLFIILNEIAQQYLAEVDRRWANGKE